MSSGEVLDLLDSSDDEQTSEDAADAALDDGSVKELLTSDEDAEPDDVPAPVAAGISEAATTARTDNDVIHEYDNITQGDRFSVVAHIGKYRLKKYDLRKTLRSEWMNDEILNLFLFVSGKPHKKVWIATSFFYKTLVGQRGVEGVERWWQRYKTWNKIQCKFSEMDYVYIPINHTIEGYTNKDGSQGSHWTLLVIDMKSKRMVHFDSFADYHIAPPTALLLKSFVKKMYEQEEEVFDRSDSSWGVTEFHGDSSLKTKYGTPDKQSGSQACGFFVCATAFCLLYDIPLGRVKMAMMIEHKDVAIHRNDDLSDVRGPYELFHWRREIALSLIGGRLSPKLKNWLQPAEVNAAVQEDSKTAQASIQALMLEKTKGVAAAEAATTARKLLAAQPAVQTLDKEAITDPPQLLAKKSKFFEDEVAGAEHIGGNHNLLFTFATRGSRWTAPLRQCKCKACGEMSNLHPMCGKCTEEEEGVMLVDTLGKGVGVRATRMIPVGTTFQYYGEVLRKPQEIGRYLHKTAPYVFISDGGSVSIDGALVRSVANMMNSRQAPAEKNAEATPAYTKTRQTQKATKRAAAAAKRATQAAAKAVESEKKQAVCKLEWDPMSGLPIARVMTEVQEGQDLELDYGTAYMYNDAFHITRVNTLVTDDAGDGAFDRHRKGS